jgi:hypothetical protein
MPAEPGRPRRCLAAAIATRVNAIVPPFFEAAGRQEDAFAAVDAVESVWRGLSLGDAGAPRDDIPAALATLRDRAAGSAHPYGPAVAFAIDAADELAAGERADTVRLPAIIAAATAVAAAYDDLGAAPPDGHPCWLEYEMGGHARLAESVFASTDGPAGHALQEIRFAAGAAALPYADAIAAALGFR